jgi:hypothetical protein
MVLGLAKTQEATLNVAERHAVLSYPLPVSTLVSAFQRLASQSSRSEI